MPRERGGVAMLVRLGVYTVYPGTVFLVLGALFFVVLYWRGVSGRVAGSSGGSAVGVGVAVVGAVAGAAGFGWLLSEPRFTAESHRWLSLPLSSLGGYWGAMAGAMLAAAYRKQSVWRAGDAVVAPLAIGGIVARLGCLYSGCCTGIAIAGAERYWPLLDMAALAVAILLPRMRRPRAVEMPLIVQFLVWYGLLRFLLELLRHGGGSAVLLMPAAQWGLGLILLVLYRRWNLPPNQDLRRPSAD